MGNWQDKLNELDATLGVGDEGDDGTISAASVGLGDFQTASGPESYPDAVSQGEHDLSAAIKGLGIVEAYTRWCGKSTPDRRTGESIMVSCPNPAHPDRTPSAWINADKGVWHCGSCEQGGDMYDIAAWYYNFPEYKHDSRAFHELRKAIGSELGFEFYPTPTGLEEPVPPGAEPRSHQDHVRTGGLPSVPPAPVPPGENVAEGYPRPQILPMPKREYSEADLADFESVIGDRKYSVGPDIDLGELCPPGTFLEAYFSACRIDDAPDEFHYINALVALSLMAGRHVTIAGDGKPYYPNLFVCLVAPSGSGKSLARGYLEDILEAVFPFEPGKGDTEGVDILPTPGSGEVFIDMLRNTHDDPAGGPIPLGEGDLRAYLDFDEISQMFAKMKAKGSMLREIILAVYDNKSSISTKSRGAGGSVAHRPFCSLTTSVQPEAVRDLIENRDISGGLINRFLFMTGTEKNERSLGQAEVDLSLAEKKLTKLKTWFAAQRAARGNIVYLTLSKDAFEAWDKFFHARLQPLRRGETGAGEAGKRAHFIAKKILMLYALNAQRLTIEVEDVELIVKLIDRLEHAWRYIAGQATRNSNFNLADVQDVREDIMRYIGPAYRKDATKPITFWSVQKHFKDERKEFPPGALEKAWNSLQNTGDLAEAQLRGKRGRGRPPQGAVAPRGITPGKNGDKGVWVAGNS